VAAYAPHYFKPVTVGDLVERCAPVAAEAPVCPSLTYHIPSMTGVNLSCAAFLRDARDPAFPIWRASNLRTENLMDYLACLRFDDLRYDILFGRDERLVAAHPWARMEPLGAPTLHRPIFQEILAFQAGDLRLATDRQVQANRIIDAMIHHGGQVAGKAMMSLMGIDCGPHVRP